MAQKYMIEGEWSGYRSSQQRVVHRHFTTRKAEADRVRKIGYGIAGPSKPALMSYWDYELSTGAATITRVTITEGDVLGLLRLLRAKIAHEIRCGVGLFSDDDLARINAFLPAKKVRKK